MQCQGYAYNKAEKTFFDTKYISDLTDASSFDNVNEDTAIFVKLTSGYTMQDVVDIVSKANAGLLVIGSDDYDVQSKFQIPTIVCSNSLITRFADHYAEKGPGNVTLSSLNVARGD